MATFDSKYTLGPEIGKGAYAKVHQCTHRQSKDICAVKIVDKSKAGPKDINDVLHEVNMMKAVGKHPHVVSMIEFFDTPTNMFIVLELLEGGMLFDRIVQLKHYSEASASRLIKNFLLALEHIHSKGVMHRDLKPENLLLKRMGKSTDKDDSYLTDFCVADFGLSCRSPGQTCCGSPSYIAPEVINVGYLRTQLEPYDVKCDIWSLGVITYILLSGQMPFQGKSFKETFAKIVNERWAFSGSVWDGHVSDLAKDFIRKTLCMNVKKRPTASEALKHQWVVNVQSDVHIPSSLEALKKFNAERKLRGAFMAFRATTALLGKLDQTPPFLKYLTHKEKTSTVLEAKSQTDPNRSHHVDYSRALLRTNPGWKLQDCCSCESPKVCRHVQNVHEYLFVGRRDMDIAPFIHELHTIAEEAELDLADTPGNKDLLQRKAAAEEALRAAYVFQEEYMKVPQEEMKANFMLESRPRDAPTGKLVDALRRAAPPK